MGSWRRCACCEKTAAALSGTQGPRPVWAVGSGDLSSETGMGRGVPADSGGPPLMPSQHNKPKAPSSPVSATSSFSSLVLLPPSRHLRHPLLPSRRPHRPRPRPGRAHTRRRPAKACSALSRNLRHHRNGSASNRGTRIQRVPSVLCPLCLLSPRARSSGVYAPYRIPLTLLRPPALRVCKFSVSS